MRAPEGDGYLEFNFSPSSEWAAYRFDSYRSGMRAAGVPPPRLLFERVESTLALSALLELGGSVSSEGAWRVALSAVIEDTSGTLSYWALAHPAARPDFHHPEGFVLELPPP
ncbi:MAG TPA: hypothetical protein VGS12_10645 [Caulobacteraceae bacterium]|nr:hypothetical protein [Caulobacteraceae bacterium]